MQQTTRDQFLNNPAFSDSNPNASRNKEIYFTHLAMHGQPTKDLKAFAARLDQDKQVYAENASKVSQNPDDLQASYTAASAATTLGKYKEAIDLYKNVLTKLDPNKTDTGQGMPVTGGNNDVNTITTKSPYTNPSASLYGIGYAQLGMKDYKQAADYFNQAVQADPTNANAKAGLARAQYYLGDKKDAQQTFLDAKRTLDQNKVDQAPAEQLQQNQQEDIAQNEESQRTLDIATGLEDFMAGDPEGKLGFVGSLNPIGKWYNGILQGTMTLGEGFKEFAKGSEEGDINKIGSSFLTIGSGAAQTAFAAIPEVQSFNMQVSAIKEAAKILPKSLNKAVDTVVDFPFQAISTMGSAMGYNPDKDSDAAKLFQMGDIVAGALFMKGKHIAEDKLAEKLQQPGQAIRDLQELSAKVANKTATPEEIDQVNKFAEYAKTLKLDDIKKAATEINTPESLALAADIDDVQKKNTSTDKEDELHDKLASLQADQDKLSEEDKPLLQQQIDAITAEIKANDTGSAEGIAEQAAKITTIADMDEAIQTLEAKKEGLSPEGKAAIQQTIDGIEQHKEALNPKLSAEETDEMEILDHAKKNGSITNEDNIRLTQLKAKQDAIQEHKAGTVLQREPIKTGKGGGERNGVESSKQGDEVADKNKQKEKIPKQTKEEFVSAQIDALKNDEESDYDESNLPFYKKYFEQKFDEKNQKAPKQKKAFATISENQSKLNSLHARIAEYNDMKNGRLGKAKPEGLKLRDSIEGEVREMDNPNVKFEVRNGYISLRNTKGRKLRPVNTEVNNRAEAENHIPLEDRDQKTKEVFDAMNEEGVHSFPVIKGMDGKRMSKNQLKAAIDDAVNGVHSNGANELLNQLDGMVKADRLTFKGGEGEYIDVSLTDAMESMKPEHNEHYEIPVEEQAALAKEYDEYFNGLSEEEKANELKNLTDETDTGNESEADASDQKNESSENESDSKSETNKSGEEVVSPPSIKDKGKNLADKIRKGKIGGVQSSIPGLTQAWNTAIETIAKAIEGGATLADAISQGIEHLKETDYYKSKTQKGKELLEKQIKAAAEKNAEEKIIPTIEESNEKASAKVQSNELEGKRKGKSVLNRLVDGDLSEEGKKAITGKGLEYTELSNKTALEIADNIISDFKDRHSETEWQDAVVDWARNKQDGIPLSINGLVLGRVAADFAAKEMATDVMSEKLEYAKMAADTVDILDTMARDFGRFNSAIQEVYQMTELGVKARIEKEIDNLNEAHLNEHGWKGGKSKRDTVKQAFDELEKLKNQFGAEVEKRVDEKMNEIMEKLPKERKSYAKKAVDALDQMEKDIMSGKITFASVIPPPVLVGIIKAAKLLIKGGMLAGEAIHKAVEQYKAENKGVDYDFETAKPKIKDYLEDKGVKDKDVPKEPKVKVAPVPDVNIVPVDEQVKILDKLFPKKKVESEKKRKEIHDKIIEAYNAKALDYDKFEKLFYEKFGLVDTDVNVVKETIDKFSKRIFNAAEGGLKEREYTNLLNFMEDHRKKSWGEYVATPFYANILSGYETHLNNTQFNMFSALAQTALLAEKNPANAGFISMKLLQNIPDGLRQGANVLMKGLRYGSAAKAETLAERKADKGAGISHYYKLPGRMLSAADTMFNTPIKRMKKAELLLKIANKYNSSLPVDQQKSKADIQAAVNDMMFQTTERKSQALEQAKNDIIKLEGKDVDFTDKNIARDLKLRQFEIMENTRPDDKYLQYGIDYNAVNEDAQDFANRSLLQGKPVGTLGAVSTILENISQGLPLSKFAITTFVNVPLNLANLMIDKSPLGLFRMGAYELRGRRGLLTTKEFADRNHIKLDLTPDQRKEAWIRATNYTAGLVGIAALAGTNYTDKDGKKRPILIVTTDGTGDYQKNKEIQMATGGEFKEYHADFMGFQFSYKYNSILAPILTPIGAVQDFQNYRAKTANDQQDMLSKVAYGFSSYMDFVGNQANLQGFRDIFGQNNSRNIDPEASMAKKIDSIEKWGMKTFRSLIVPNFAIQANRDIKGLMGKADSKPVAFYDYAMKDVPFFDSLLAHRYDHFGREIKSQASVPVALVPDKLNIEGKDAVYRMTIDHKYYPTYSTKKQVFNGTDEVNLTDDQMNEMNRLRGQYVLNRIMSPKTYGEIKGDQLREEDADLKDKKMFDMLNDLDNDAFADQMGRLFKEGELFAKSQIMGFDVKKTTDKQSRDKKTATTHKEQQFLLNKIKEFNRAEKN